MAATGEFFRQGKSRLSLQQEEREVEAHNSKSVYIHLFLKFNIEVWLSLVERFVRDEEAAGSNPVTSTKKANSNFRFGFAFSF